MIEWRSPLLRLAPAAIALALTLTVLTTASAGHGWGAGCDRAWRVFSTTEANRYTSVYDDFDRIALRGADDVWAVGARELRSRRIHYPLLGHWDGSRWREWRLPSTGRVADVALLPSGEMWAAYGGAQAVGLLQWDGRRLVRQPSPTRHINALTNLAATRDGSLWLTAIDDQLQNGGLYRRTRGAWRRVGSEYALEIAPGPDGRIWSLNGLHHEVARWNGTRWVSVPPPGLQRERRLEGLGMTLAGQFFLWGWDSWDDDANARPLLLRWAGAGWTRAATPTLPVAAGIRSVAGATADDLWISIHESGRRLDGPLLRWDGFAWLTVDTPTANPPTGDQAGARWAGRLAMAGDDLWIVDGSVVRYGCRRPSSAARRSR